MAYRYAALGRVAKKSNIARRGISVAGGCIAFSSLLTVAKTVVSQTSLITARLARPGRAINPSKGRAIVSAIMAAMMRPPSFDRNAIRADQERQSRLHVLDRDTDRTAAPYPLPPWRTGGREHDQQSPRD